MNIVSWFYSASMKHKAPFLFIMLAIFSFFLPGCFSRDPYLPTVDRVELQQIEGDWHVTHHIPYWLEKGKLAPIDAYKIRDDGKIDVEYRFRDGSLDAPEETWKGYAWVVDPVSNAHWKVRFLWPFKTDYMIIDKDPSYQWLVVGHPSRDYLWILSRSTQLSPAVYDRISVKIETLGFDPSRVVAIPQLESNSE